MVQFLGIINSKKKGKKYDAVFFNDNGLKVKIPFGAAGYEDFTMHKDVNRMRLYQQRHQNDNLNDPMSPGALSWFILWTAPNLFEGLNNYKNRFGFR